MALYRTAAKGYPDDSALFQGLGYCASNAGLHEEAASANRRALELEPENQTLVNDLGWTLLQAGQLSQASRRGELSSDSPCSAHIPLKHGRHRRPSQRIRLAVGHGIKTPMWRTSVSVVARLPTSPKPRRPPQNG